MNFQECFNKPLFDQEQINFGSSTQQFYHSHFQVENIPKGVGFFSNVDIVTFSKGEIEVEDQKIITKLKQNKSNTLNKENKFNCSKCKKNIDMSCIVCEGKTQINGQNNLVKFFQYVLEFKLGLKPAYQSNKLKHRLSLSSTFNQRFLEIPKNQQQRNALSSSYGGYSQCKKSIQLSRSNFLEKQSIHKDFYCDNCEKSPIEGVRYHCGECKDFDLCDQCFNQKGHEHPLKQVKTTSLQNQMLIFLNHSYKSSITKSSQSNEFNNQQIFASLIG